MKMLTETETTQKKTASVHFGIPKQETKAEAATQAEEAEIIPLELSFIILNDGIDLQS